MVAMIMLALPVQEFTIPAYTTTFIIGNSTQDFMTGALIRHFICGDFIEGFLAIGFTEDSGTTVFIPGSTPGSVRDSIQDFSGNRLSPTACVSSGEQACSSPGLIGFDFQEMGRRSPGACGRPAGTFRKEMRF